MIQKIHLYVLKVIEVYVLKLEHFEITCLLFHLNEKISIGLKSNQEVGASKLIMYMRKIPLKSYPFQFLNPELYPTKPLKGIKLVILTCKGIDVLMFQNVIKKFCIAEDCFFFFLPYIFFSFVSQS